MRTFRAKITNLKLKPKRDSQGRFITPRLVMAALMADKVNIEKIKKAGR